MHPTPHDEHIFLFTQPICICTTIFGANDCDLGEYQQKAFLLTLPLCLSASRGKKKCIPGIHKHVNILGLTEANIILISPRKSCIVALCEITRDENWRTFCSRTPKRCFQKKKVCSFKVSWTNQYWEFFLAPSWYITQEVCSFGCLTSDSNPPITA